MIIDCIICHLLLLILFLLTTTSEITKPDTKLENIFLVTQTIHRYKVILNILTNHLILNLIKMVDVLKCNTNKSIFLKKK